MFRKRKIIGLILVLFVGILHHHTYATATESNTRLQLTVSAPTTKSTQLEITGTPNSLAKIDFGFKVYERRLDANGKAVFFMNPQPIGKKINVTLVSSNLSNVSVTVTVKLDPHTLLAPKVTTVFNTSRHIIFTGPPGEQIHFSVNRGKFSGTFDSKGIYKFNMLPQRTGSIIRAVTVTTAQKSSETITVVKEDITAPATPVTTSIVKTTSTSVKGKTEPFATLILTIGSETYRAQAEASGLFTVTFPRQPINRKLTLQAMDAARNISSPRIIIVQSALYENFYRINTDTFDRLLLHKDTFNIFGVPRQSQSVAPIFFGSPTKGQMAVEMNIRIAGNKFIDATHLRFIVDGIAHSFPFDENNVMYYNAEIADDDSYNRETVLMTPETRLIIALKAIRHSAKPVTVVVNGKNGNTTWFLSASERRAIRDALQYAGY
ncbi:Ig-like domain-containing protein [Exiguobacterium sp.]|uniref:Ig-like domain-containing protein n=1 Tax=Exiguobacterium sp. TaxID=44751 RepID=UPI00263AB5A1|nr:Ig-like domain-containing protein [Exiguobacterium sp.]MCC5891970.1 hypothetical protein [Exiguobacterium sp.]